MLENYLAEKALEENIVTKYDYERYETYVHTSSLSLFRVKAVGDLHFNVNNMSGEVERCNRLAILTNINGSTDILYYVYLCDHYALNPPKVGQIVDAQLHFIESVADKSPQLIEYFWADSITPIDENVKRNNNDDFLY